MGVQLGGHLLTRSVRHWELTWVVLSWVVLERRYNGNPELKARLARVKSASPAAGQSPMATKNCFHNNIYKHSHSCQCQYLSEISVPLKRRPLIYSLWSPKDKSKGIKLIARSRILQQRGATQTEPAYSLDRNPSPHSQTLARSRT